MFDAIADHKTVVYEPARAAPDFQHIVNRLPAPPERVDILGGGLIGSSAAFRLTDREGTLRPRQPQNDLHRPLSPAFIVDVRPSGRAL